MTLRPSHPRAKPRWILALAGVGVLLAVAIGSALAVHNDGLFELDTSTNQAICTPITQPCGDANVADPAGGGDDWATIYAGGGAAFGSTFIPDPVSDAETSYYTGGGSKDVNDIPQWQYATSNDVVPDKDDLAHAFAAAYTNPADSHVQIYFGVDRYDNNGDAETGFWFFQNRVQLGANGAFTGTHRLGDVLVLADWGGSNPVGALTVYTWVGGKNPLQLVSDTAAGGADCAKVGLTDNVCAVVNRQTVTQPWTFTDKAGSTTIRTLELFEAGLDVTALFGADRCFSSFLASTRSSHSTTAQLKDFALGGFEQCGASISITPDDVNEVGQSHTFTVHVSKTVGGAPAPAAGVFPVVTLTGADGAVVAAGKVDTCATTGTNAAGDCTVTFTSASTGTITGHATAAVTIGSDTFNVATDGVSPNTGDAVKRFVDAEIKIEGNGTNEVGAAHTFTVTVKQDLGGAAGVVAADNGHVSFTLTPSNGATPVVNTATSTCDDAGDNLSAAGTCTIVFTSATTGQVRGDASVTIPMAVFGTAADVVRDTNSATATIGAGIGGSETDPLKTFVDANIAIAGNDTNSIQEPHTFTVTVKKDLGAGGGLVAADNGHVIVTLTNTLGANYVIDAAASTCDDAGDNLSAAGTCTIVFTSATAGTVTGDASVTIPMAVFGTAADVVRDTDSSTPAGAGTGGSNTDAVKIFIDGSLTWLKHDGAGALLGGATFEVCMTHRLNSAGAGTMVAEPDTNPDPLIDSRCFTVFDAADGTATAPDTDIVGGQIKVEDLVLGRYTVRETIPPAGYHIKTPPGAGPFTFPDMSIGSPNVTLGTIFVNVRAFRIIVIGCDDTTHELVASGVTFNGGTEVQSMTATELGIWNTAHGTSLTEADICGDGTKVSLGGAASFGGLNPSTYAVSVRIPS